MCEWGTSVTLTLPALRSGIIMANREWDVDACIAPVVKALNDAGISTIASCCGHGKAPGNITLVDGRELFVVGDYNAARNLDAAIAALGEPE